MIITLRTRSRSIILSGFIIIACLLLLYDTVTRLRIVNQPDRLDYLIGKVVPKNLIFEKSIRFTSNDWFETPLVLIVFSTECPSCHDNAAKWRELISSIDDAEIQVLLISVESGPSVDQFIHHYELENINYQKNGYEFSISMKIGSTPVYLKLKKNREVVGASPHFNELEKMCR